MERMAELEERKLLLRDKRTMIDRAFQKALERLLAMPSDKARAFLVETVAQSAAGDETVIARCRPCRVAGRVLCGRVQRRAAQGGPRGQPDAGEGAPPRREWAGAGKEQH